MSGVLYKEGGTAAGYWDVIEWIVYNYPTDIFVMENQMWCEIRDRARAILMTRLDAAKIKSEVGDE